MPSELVIGRKDNLKTLRIWGCPSEARCLTHMRKSLTLEQQVVMFYYPSQGT